MIKIRRLGHLLVVLAVALLLGDDWQPPARPRAGRHARGARRQLVPAGWSPLPEHVRRSIAPVYYGAQPA